MDAERGLIRFRSERPVPETVALLQQALESRRIEIFTVIDHSGEAEKSGMAMPPTKGIVFGSPKAGTPLMVAAPSLAIDLPLKALVAEGDDGSVWVSLSDPAYLQARHRFPEELMGNLAGAGALIEKTLEGRSS